MKNKEDTATILEIVRMSTEDGPGIRTTVFFKGCPLSCAWCHNPESISVRPQVVWVETRCIGCRTCEDVCDNSAISHTPDGIEINREKCVACGDCATECPTTALEIFGKKWGVEELAVEVLKDRAYFSNSGGVTVSGGEPTIQAGFTAAFLARLRKEGIHTALDTCGLTTKNALEKILPHAAMVMFDLKIMDPDDHKKFCGQDNKAILENARFVADYIRSHIYPKELWIRTPLIPNATASEKNISAIGGFIADNLSGVVTRWDLCAFNNLCRDKYRRLGIDWMFTNTELMTAEELDCLGKAAENSGVDPKIVLTSGSTRLDENTEDKEPAQSTGGNIRLCCSTGPQLD
ncbi:MAG: glycyl-radical enzyme activating protein [Deltaproteobacteria bacterium]|nr:glycyl-radical enzyme activating protein [Deltaproteobacteria bacterium]